MTVCQTDGFLFRDMAVVTLIAETIEEIVPVAYLETFFAFGVLQRLAEVELHLQVDGRRILPDSCASFFYILLQWAVSLLRLAASRFPVVR